MELISFDAQGACVKGFLQEDYPNLKAHRTRPAIIICPGGAYQWLSPREQDPVAFEFLSMGYQVFILSYDCGEKAGGYRPLRQLAKTVEQIREKSEDWHIERDRIAVLGFSAGGHLAACLGALWNDPELGLGASSRPDALILCYPVISMYEYANKDSSLWVSGGDENVRRHLHLFKQITSAFPPTFMWHGGQDESVPVENSLLLAVELKRNHVPFEYHLFETGRHGISTCTQEVETPEDICRAWVGLCKKWLNHRFEYVP